jgi:hypothetical protein
VRGMARWEYLVRTRRRDKGVMQIESWKDDVVKDLSTLGDQGWELVSVSPQAGIIGAGAPTTAELWVFKRPKS